MKKAYLLSAAFGLAYAVAAPTYYTFTGTVSFVATDVGGYAAAHGIRAASAVTFYVAVDTSRAGYNKNNGAIAPQADIHNPGYTADYFFDSLLTPSLFSPAVTDTASGSCLGYHTITTSATTTRNALAFTFTFGNPDHRTQLVINIPDSGHADFMPKVGAKVAAVESYVDSSVASSGVSMVLTVTAVSNTRPNGLRPIAPPTAGWMTTEFRNGELILRNKSGSPATATLLNASGRRVLSRTLGEKSSISMASVPHGRLFLEITSPQTEEAFHLAFFH